MTLVDTGWSQCYLRGDVPDIKEAHSLRVSGVFDDFIGVNVGMQVYFLHTKFGESCGVLILEDS